MLAAWKRFFRVKLSLELAANRQRTERLEVSAYDLVLFDLMMPDKSGCQVLAEVLTR